ncbi:hypothetical protein HOD38_00680 [archaeon]|jgi:hypothetical protein|nr:hypothetical protein [archaeon]MBT4396760.1 hypothetical protein [archaeon]MBT4441370.1 hypothetical protein [archaeon]
MAGIDSLMDAYDSQHPGRRLTAHERGQLRTAARTKSSWYIPGRLGSFFDGVIPGSEDLMDAYDEVHNPADRLTPNDRDRLRTAARTGDDSYIPGRLRRDRW